VRPGRSAQAYRAEELQREAVLPVVVAEAEEIAARRGAGVVHQRIEAAEACDRTLDDLLRGIRFAQVQRAGHGVRRQRCRECLQRIAGTRHEHQAIAIVRQLLRDRATDTAAGAGDNGDARGHRHGHAIAAFGFNA